VALDSDWLPVHAQQVLVVTTDCAVHSARPVMQPSAYIYGDLIITI
jgi:hypothetical protein